MYLVVLKASPEHTMNVVALIVGAGINAILGKRK